MIKEAEIKILENLSNKDEVLNLSAMGLTEIPRSVFELTHLRELKLMYNKIKVIPEEVAKLKNVTHLYLYSNKIKDLPIKSIREMYSLKHIDLADNFVDYNIIKDAYNEVKKNRGYSGFIKKLSELKPDSTYFSFYEEINHIPKELFNFKNLEHISIHGVNIKEIPSEIGNLKKLKDLSLSGNKLKKIPKELYNIQTLESIDLDSNKFKEFPQKLLGMQNLKMISFNSNKITHIKKHLDKVVKNEEFKCFSFGDNPLKDFDSDLFRGGLDYIKEYFYRV